MLSGRLRTSPLLSCCLVCLLAQTLFGALVQGAWGQSFLAGQPHLSVSPGTYHVIMPSGQLVTPSMCQAADAFCLSQAVGQPLFTSVSGVASDLLGNLYVTDLGVGTVTKLSPSGAPLLIGGEYGIISDFPGPTGVATRVPLGQPTAITVDGSGDVYVASVTNDSSYLIRIDPLGTATQLTAGTETARQAQDGAYASTQLVSPLGLTSDTAGNVYFGDALTCTIREFVRATNRLKVIGGSLTAGCSNTPFSDGVAATSVAFGVPAGVAVQSDGTVIVGDYDFAQIFSITTDGLIHHVIGSGSATLVTGEDGDIGFPLALTLDGAGNIYMVEGDVSTFGYGVVEVTKGTVDAPSQVVLLAGDYPAYDFFYGLGTAEGSPATDTFVIVQGRLGSLALDPFGRLILPAVSQDSIVSYARDGAFVFPTNHGSTGQALLTFTNSGSSPLTGVSFGTAGLPYRLSPTADEIAAGGGSGAAPFTIDQTIGSCLAKFTAGSFSLAPGESCTLAIDWSANTSVPPAGTLTFYTNDPRGPISVNLMTGEVETDMYGTPFFSTSEVSVTPAAAANRTGNFSIKVGVISSEYSTFYQMPSGPVILGITNNATGAVVYEETANVGTDGTASFTVTGLKPGTYSAQAAYGGDSSTIAAFSPVESLFVKRNGVDVTEFATSPYYVTYGATGEFLNFIGTGYSVGQFVENEDFLAGNTAVTFDLKDSYGFSEQGTTKPLTVDHYTVSPQVTNAAALSYSTTLRSFPLYVLPRHLDVFNNSRSIYFGTYVTATGPGDATHLSLLNNPYVQEDDFVFLGDVARGDLTLTTVVNPGANNGSSTLLPVGVYPITTQLSGARSEDYILSNDPGRLTVEKLPVTIKLASLTVASGSTILPSQLVAAIGGPDPAALLGDSTNQLMLSFTSASQPGMSIANQAYASATPFSLPAGTYNVSVALPVTADDGNYAFQIIPAVITFH